MRRVLICTLRDNFHRNEIAAFSFNSNEEHTGLEREIRDIISKPECSHFPSNEDDNLLFLRKLFCRCTDKNYSLNFIKSFFLQCKFH